MKSLYKQNGLYLKIFVPSKSIVFSLFICTAVSYSIVCCGKPLQNIIHRTFFNNYSLVNFVSNLCTLYVLVGAFYLSVYKKKNVQTVMMLCISYMARVRDANGFAIATIVLEFLACVDE